MNIELLDPFGRQVPDRVDATIQLADVLHYPTNENNVESTSTSQPQISSSNKHKEKHNKNYDVDGEVDDMMEMGGDDDEDEVIATAQRSTNSGSNIRRSKKSDTSGVDNNQTISNKTNSNKDHHHHRNDGDMDWKAAYHVSYNRRGNYIAVGYGSGTIAIFCTLTRTLISLYYYDKNPNSMSKGIDQQQQNQNSNVQQGIPKKKKDNKMKPNYGCSNLSWSRRSRRLLAGNVGDTYIRLYDTTHPAGSEECATGAAILVSVGQTAASAAAAAALAASSSAVSDPLDDGDADSMTNWERDNKTKVNSPVIRHSLGSTTTHQQQQPGVSSSSTTEVPPIHPLWQTQPTPFVNNDDDQHSKYRWIRKSRMIPSRINQPNIELVLSNSQGRIRTPDSDEKTTTNTTKKKRYPCITFHLPNALAGSLYIHPRHLNIGMAVLDDGQLIIFWIHTMSSSSPFIENDDSIHETEHTTSHDANDSNTTTIAYDEYGNVMMAHIFPIVTNGFAICASFDPLGDRIYAVTKSGQLFGFNMIPLWKQLLLFDNNDSSSSRTLRIPSIQPTFQISIYSKPMGDHEDTNITGSSSSHGTIWHLLVSRNGKFLILNTSEGTIRLYSTAECWGWGINRSNNNINSNSNSGSISSLSPPKPLWVFQDVVTKVKFTSCDLSGDGEYVVGGANNGIDNKYELHIWNTSTGALMDKLTGASTKLYSVTWHPTRSFVAVACVDGLIDIWGPRINWTAFAPDFQALPMNVEYIEREDEFDVDEHGRHLAIGSHHDCSETTILNSHNEISRKINVTTTESIPVFASDTEDEDEIFEFETRVKNVLVGRIDKINNKRVSVGLDD